MANVIICAPFEIGASKTPVVVDEILSDNL